MGRIRKTRPGRSPSKATFEGAHRQSGEAVVAPTARARRGQGRGGTGEGAWFGGALRGVQTDPWAGETPRDARDVGAVWAF